METIALWVLLVVGAVVVTVVAVAIAILAVGAFWEWRKEPHQRSYFEGSEDARNRLANDAWWFSESTATCELLRDLSRGANVSAARDKWRKARLSELVEEKKN